MYIVCIESSNSRGMGHLFRALLYADYLKQHKTEFLLLVNDDANSLKILKEKNIEFKIVDFSDKTSNWEEQIIRKYKVDTWINDKFETSWQMAKHIKDANVLLCLIDDTGKGEMFADIHFAGMIYPTRKSVGGKYTFYGNEYIVLNPEIALYRHRRNTLNRIVVSLGGSDPHGVTLDVVKELLQYPYAVDVVIGPNFIFREELEKLNRGRFSILQNVPSLIATFASYDLAVTGGGVTCCEANAAGLPCIIIANAAHEVNTGRYMESFGGCIYAGSYEKWNRKVLANIGSLNISEMSSCGMDNFYLDAVERIMNTITRVKGGIDKNGI